MDLIPCDIVQTELPASFLQFTWFPNDEKKTSPPLHKLSGFLQMLIPAVLSQHQKEVTCVPLYADIVVI